MKNFFKGFSAIMIAMTVILVFASCEKESIPTQTQEQSIVKAGIIRTINIPENTYLTNNNGVTWKVSGWVRVEISFSFPFVKPLGGHIVLENQVTHERLEFDYSVSYNNDGEEDGLNIDEGDNINMEFLTIIHNYICSNVADWIE